MIRSLATKLGVGVALGTTLLLAACGSTSTSGNTVSCPNAKGLNGAGSTFDNLLFTQMFATYAKGTCGIRVNYQSVGSGAGITQLLAQTVDFGATDSPMTDADMAKSTNGPIVHIPVTLGGVAISYNQPAFTAAKRLQLKGDTLANIFLGKITKWNDPAIAADNSGVTLPDQAITVVHRSDGSGTTGIFTHYLDGGQPRLGGRPEVRAPRSTGQLASAPRATTASPTRSRTPLGPSATTSWATFCRTASPTRQCRTRMRAASSSLRLTPSLPPLAPSQTFLTTCASSS